MNDLSLYVLDIAMNSVRAGASELRISLREEGELLTFTAEDNGCGMTPEQVRRLSDPFFTTRKTRRVGLGIPFLTMLAEMTGGSVSITSTPERESAEHGTRVLATFGRHHIDFIPIGDMASTVVTLIQGAPNIDLTFLHERGAGRVFFSARELRQLLGEEISLAEPEILAWIKAELDRQYSEEMPSEM